MLQAMALMALGGHSLRAGWVVLVYRMHLADALPATLTPAQTEAATRTLADAAETSKEVRQPVSAELFDSAGPPSPTVCALSPLRQT